MKIEGKTAIITGASSGFGKALAWRIARKGGNVVLGDISAPAGKALTDEINAQHPRRAVFAVCDVTSKKDQEALFTLAKTQFGSIDIVINNAGIGETRVFATDTTDSWLSVLRIDLEAVILGTRLALTHMWENTHGGVIVNTASLAGLYPQPFQPVYAAAKGGVVHFTRSFDALAKERGIRVNAVCPSFSPTGIVESAKKAYGPEIAKFMGSDMVPVELVIDAFILAIEDESLSGAALRVTKQHGIDRYSWARSRPSL
ncbi:hypothetical protein HDU89_003607 [Geranomyces variabilis]|nr:hypothetical protein BDZ88DRAFT_421836 [Geranomyces variabilis]KAJ3140956.1 hypothetical protein HDU90_006977 [Geranomyces variabilis]KAJ3149556.1 hypothetical protein HDU89_003607 [Geranomyces variabilis]